MALGSTNRTVSFGTAAVDTRISTYFCCCGPNSQTASQSVNQPTSLSVSQSVKVSKPPHPPPLFLHGPAIHPPKSQPALQLRDRSRDTQQTRAFFLGRKRKRKRSRLGCFMGSLLINFQKQWPISCCSRPAACHPFLCRSVQWLLLCRPLYYWCLTLLLDGWTDGWTRKRGTGIGWRVVNDEILLVSNNTRISLRFCLNRWVGDTINLSISSKRFRTT